MLSLAVLVSPSMHVGSVPGCVMFHAITDTDGVRHVPDAPEVTKCHVVTMYTWYTCGVTKTCVQVMSTKLTG